MTQTYAGTLEPDDMVETMDEQLGVYLGPSDSHPSKGLVRYESGEVRELYLNQFWFAPRPDRIVAICAASETRTKVEAEKPWTVPEVADDVDWMATQGVEWQPQGLR